MEERPLVLQHTRDLDVGVNEIVQRFSFNRNVRRLLSNDIELESLYERYLNQMNVFEYTKGHTYKQGDLVWVRRSTGDFKLFLVRCIIAENKSDLQDIVDRAYSADASKAAKPEFDRYGWKDENDDIDVSDYGIDRLLAMYFSRRFVSHENDEEYHRFGTLRNNGKDADEKILLADLSNADSKRETVFYPYYTRKINPDASILYGFYRVWDCGTLELDLVFRLGYAERRQADGYVSEVIECNSFSMAGIEYANASTARYFNTVKDRDIFAPRSSGQSEIDGIMQVNRNDYVNTYTADIKFPQFTFRGKSIQFVDDQYMVFGSDVMSQDANTANSQIEPSANCMTFCGKSRRGFTALYVTYPDKGNFNVIGYNAQNGGLVSNSFHCHVVGRWMEEPIQT